MTTFLTTGGIPNVTIALVLNGRDFKPEYGYDLGVLQVGDKLQLGIEVAEGLDHRCFTLDSKMVRTDKAPVKAGLYIKNFTVTARSEKGVRSTQIAGWPNNMVCLEIGNKAYNIGLFTQNGRYFFAIVEKSEPLMTDAETPIGTVTRFDVLRGVARVYTGDRFQETRLHWSKMPFRRNFGFRAVREGEVIKFDPKSVVETGAAKTSFSKEIVKGVLVY